MSDTQKKRVPANTAQEAKADPMGIIARATVEGSSQMIYNMEAEGQEQFVGSDTLPTDIGRYSDFDGKAILEAAGVVFGEVVEGDPLFQYAKLPEGWTRDATTHDMHSKILDEKGRERASVFYKAAFYDRRADMNLSRRFDVRQDYDRKKKGEAVAIVTDCGNPIHITDVIPITDPDKPWPFGELAVAAATNWLTLNYPDWRNPGAYWD